MAICPAWAYYSTMRLAAALLRVPLAIIGEITDRLLGPDEMKGLTWPNTTPDETLVKEKDPLGYEIIRGPGW